MKLNPIQLAAVALTAVIVGTQLGAAIVIIWEAVKRLL